MSLAVRIDPTDPTPPYEQLRRRLAVLIDTGVLAVGVRLPPVRQLAADLGLATGTVARTYKELEQAGFVVTRRGGGTVVTRPPARDVDDRLRVLTADHVAAARAIGADDAAILDAVRAALG